MMGPSASRGRAGGLARERLLTENAQEWRWVGEDGVEKKVDEPELIAELSSESLPNYTLVWRRGWVEWLPAMQVQELSWALPPGKSDEHVTPREHTGAGSPPAPPLYRYPVLKRRAANLRSDKPLGPPSHPPPAETSQHPNAGIDSERLYQPYGGRPLGAEVASVEDVEFDAIEASSPRAASNPASSPGAPRRGSDPRSASEDLAFKGSAYGEEDEAETRVLPSKPPPAVAYVGPHSPPPQYTPIDDAEEIPRFPRPPRSPVNLGAYSGSTEQSTHASSRSKVPYALGAAALVALLAVIYLVQREAPEPVATAVAPSSSAPLAAPSASAPRTATAPRAPETRAASAVESGPPSACKHVAKATKIADWADPSVMPAFADIPGSSRVAVGFAQSDTYAIGITIDPRSFDRDQVFREFRKEKLSSVVPTIDDGKLHFQVCRDGTVLGSARAVNGPPTFFLGSTEAGVARARGKGAPEPIWKLEDAKSITVPRVASIEGIGHAAVFRRGGKTGQVTMGWLGENGKKRSELKEIPTGGEMTGTPAVAASEEGVLIVFAAMKTGGSGWSLELGTSKPGGVPSTTQRFSLPPGGPGGDAIAPSAAALPGGRWLLQWTEGAPGSRVVRAQVLDRDLSPRGGAIDLSPAGANAGQGIIWAREATGTVLFYVRSPKNTHELWGASISCQP
jgi:hypothetical protein